MLILLFVIATTPVYGAGKAKANEESAINTETLTGGIVHKEGYYLPRGFKIPCSLRTPIDTRVSQVSDLVTVQTTEDILLGDYTVIPANSFLHGYISKLEGPGKFQKKAQVELAFDSLSMPGKDGGRRQVALKGSIKTKEILKAGTSVNDGALYKSRAVKAGILGAAAGTLGAYGIGEAGITFLTGKAFLAASGLGGALLAANLISRDDVRLEPGVDLDIILQEPAVELFAEHHPLSHEFNKDLTPEDAYDKYGDMKSEPLQSITNKQKAQKSDAKKAEKLAQNVYL